MYFNFVGVYELLRGGINVPVCDPIFHEKPSHS